MDALLSVNPGLIIWTLINFFLFFFLLGKFGFKPMLAALEAREQRINDSINQAEQANELAQKSMQETREKLAKAQSEVMDMLKEGKVQAETIIRNASEEAERIKQAKLEEALREIAREKDIALQSLRTEMGSLIVQATDKVIGKVVNAEQHRSLIDATVNELSNN
ncbi:MAG: F0F1 ATP synthase subunit B [Ignavibacteria bacterium]|nr:F0F1 ATP synthase subunit B [Ignavibacteria bacterium]MBM4173706.1 F0F1 ATP synthase subunit B [Ignavibacteria bacterium]